MQAVEQLIQNFIPNHYQLKIDLQRSQRQFSGQVIITGQTETSLVKLHSKDLNITSAKLNHQPAQTQQQADDVLVINEASFTGGKVELELEFSGQITDAMHGLYPCYFKHDDKAKELLATQFESHHAREVFPCVDEPAAKATFDVSLITETNVEVLGNMPVTNQTETNGRLETTFATTPQMSSYLLAWVVGDMHKISAKTKRGIEVNVWATKAQRPESLDFALEHAVKSIDFFEEYFAIDYPLPKSDHVALPDFSSGAMENWGLVTYREIALLTDPKTTTIASKHYVATVISHELSHQWFGNLVTMQWWNNLWLNESFATLMEYIAVDAIWPDWNIWLDFAAHESVLALRRDAIDGVQPVQVEVKHPDEISTIFDGAIVYAKGARLMRMCQNFIGHKAFRAGLASYFKEFAYKNTAADDLWSHLSSASGKDINQMMNTWISQPGYPVVHVKNDTLEQEQFFVGPHKKSTKLWPIPLDTTDSTLPQLLEKSNLQTALKPSDRLNKNNAAHFISHYQPEHLLGLLQDVAKLDEVNRLQLLNEQTLLARGEVIASAQLIDMLQAYAQESAESVWSIMALTLSELKKFVESNVEAEAKLKQFAGNLAAAEFKRLGWEIKPDETADETKLRSIILSLTLYSEDEATLKQASELYSQGVESINSEVRSLVLSSVVKQTNDSQVIKDLINLHATTASADLRDDLCAGLTSVRKSAHVELVLAELTKRDSIKPQDIFRWFAYLMRSRYTRKHTWDWLVNNWSWIEQTFAGDKSYDDFPRYAANGLVTRTELKAYRDFFEPRKATTPALARAVELGTREIEARVELIERDGPAVINKLTSL